MRSNQRHVFFVFALICFCALFGVFGATAQKKSEQAAKQGQAPAQRPVGQKDAQQPVQQKDDEPVAITERVKVEKPVEVKAPTADQFGNFRPPIINNKGEIAFISLFNSPKAKDGFDQSIFVRGAGGSWKITSQGEKAVNLPQGIHGFGGLLAFNDNGDLTFIADYGDHSPKPAPASDANDPFATRAAERYKSIYVKSSSGLKSLVKLGDEVPAMPSHFTGFANASTSGQGVTAFIGTYSDPDGKGLFMIEGGKLRLVCRSGQPIGNGEAGTFSEHYYPTHINERNEVAFLARVGDKSGIFVSRPKGIELITLIGKPAPIKGANFIGFGNRTPALGDNGEVAFVGFYDGPEAGRGLFTKGDGPIKVVAKSGDKIGDTNYAFTDFLHPAINSRGDVAFIGKYGGRNQSLFIKTAKGLEMIAAVDQPVPGGIKGETFNNFTQASINDRGEVAFYAQTKNPTTGVDVGIFVRDEKGNVKPLVRRGEKMPK
ncbi:MAG: choice-of-anchor tandem repeat NxxGxxAF-containing protein [Blastocatellales bacterium]